MLTILCVVAGDMEVDDDDDDDEQEEEEDIKRMQRIIASEVRGKLLPFRCVVNIYFRLQLLISLQSCVVR